jgi:ABC-type antimicrobial peptide transport system permease subunit
LNSLRRLINELDSFLPTKNGEVNSIANANLWSVSLTSTEYYGLDKAHLATFINQIYKMIESQWDKPFVFYANLGGSSRVFNE